MPELNLKFGLKFKQLYDREGLVTLDQIFLNGLLHYNQTLHSRLVAARSEHLDNKEYSQLILAMAEYVEEFISNFFLIENEYNKVLLEHKSYDPLYSCKRLFVQRRALKQVKPEDIESFMGTELDNILGADFTELDFATQIMAWLNDEEINKEYLKLASFYAYWASISEAGRLKHQNGIIFNQPKKLDFEHLIATKSATKHNVTSLTAIHYKKRQGFDLTDSGANLAKVLDEANYCIYCHHQGKDSCSKGLKDKDQSFKSNNFGVKLTGCPLEEKISEMNELKTKGFFIAALACAMIDNPLLAATGHRICNDCMKSCIYQKQQPVDIPQIETRTLKDVLDLPWGFEIYSLLSRWNPLNIERPYPKSNSNYNILVAGLGPAGFSLAYHLLAEGHQIVAIDGLKIEPLPPEICGINNGIKGDFIPIFNVDSLYEDLSKRTSYGFGGVAEYGITVRWNKNYLKLIRLLLERQANFTMFGSTRFGSQITYDNVQALGFDHVALALGAGKPTLVEMPNMLVKGVKTASDFLMSLQLSGAAREDTIANLQIELPVIVIGGGLTAIDTATEALAYYPVQIAKFAKRYQQLVLALGQTEVEAGWNSQEKALAKIMLSHHQQIEESDDHIKLLQDLGGVKVIYRKNLSDAPSFRLNHEEVELALQEGISFIPNQTPIRIITDDDRHVIAIELKGPDGVVTEIAARTVIFAAGTSPNNIIVQESPNIFKLDGKYLQALDEDGELISPELSAKPQQAVIFTHLPDDNISVSFFGDLHPSYAGNVVKAMASAKAGYKIISKKLFENKPLNLNIDYNQLLSATIYQVNRLTSNIIEVIVKAPLAAKQFKPGQFYRLQNYEYFAEQKNNTKLAMEGLALTGASVDIENGLLSMIVLEMGGSSNLCAYLPVGQKVALMGPTGEATEIIANKKILLIGGGLGNAVLFSIGKAMKLNNSHVTYVAGYRQVEDCYKINEIEEAADQILWCCDQALLAKNREQDLSFHGNIIDAIDFYKDELKLSEIDHIIAIGSDKMMQAVQIARNGKFKHYLKKDHQAIASINSPMQCMMKEICAQCLQKHIDPNTGLETYIYSCNSQDQKMEQVDFAHLDARLKQNSLQEKLTASWLSRM